MKLSVISRRFGCLLLLSVASTSLAQSGTPISTNAPTVTISATDSRASEIGPDTGTFTVYRKGPTNDALTVFYRIGGAASNGVDYVTISNIVSIPAGALSATITITPLADNLVEGNESVEIALTAPPVLSISQYFIGSPASAVVTIADGNEITRSIVNIVATDPDATEIPEVPPGMGLVQRFDPAVFTVTRSGPTNLDLTVFYEIGGTASNGVDYVALPSTLVIPHGSASAILEVDPIDDLLVEGTETVIIAIHPPVCSAIFPPPPDCYLVGPSNRAIAYIHDNDSENPSNAPPVVNIVTPANGATFLGPANILIAANARDIDDSVSTVEFFEGTNSLGVRTNFPVLNPIGPFALAWTNVPVGKYTLTALATDSRGAKTVSEPVRIAVVETNRPPATNPPPFVSITATDPIASEGTNFWWWPISATDGTNMWATPTPIIWRTNLPDINTATFKVRRGDNTNSDLTVYYSISGTASNGVDYETLPGSLTIAAGQRSAVITIIPIDDSIIEPIETVVLKLRLPPGTTDTNPAPYAIGYPRQAAALIVDNDGPRPPCRILPDGLFHLCEAGTNGFCYRLETSTNMLNWIPVCTNIVSEGAVHFVDPDAVDLPNRFYRTFPEANPPAD